MSTCTPTPGDYWYEEDEEGPEGMAGKLAENVTKVTEGLKQKLQDLSGGTAKPPENKPAPPKGKIPTSSD